MNNSVSSIQQSIEYRQVFESVNERVSLVPPPAPGLFAFRRPPVFLNDFPPLLLEPIDVNNTNVGSMEQGDIRLYEQQVIDRDEKLKDTIQNKLLNHAQWISHENMCSICMGETTYGDLASDSFRFTTSCKHSFCIKCITMWIFTKVKENSQSRKVDCLCPMCRTCFYTHKW